MNHRKEENTSKYELFNQVIKTVVDCRSNGLVSHSASEVFILRLSGVCLHHELLYK